MPTLPRNDTSVVVPKDIVQARHGRPLPELILSKTYRDFLSAVGDELDRTAQNVAFRSTVNLSQQAASIPTTPMTLGALPAGLYRVSYYLRVTQAASLASAAQVTLSWTEQGVPLTLAGEALDANDVSAVRVGTILVMIDANTAIGYAVDYTSDGATPAQYRLRIVVERVELDGTA
jgi:hypothetical protein